MHILIIVHVFNQNCGLPNNTVQFVQTVRFVLFVIFLLSLRDKSFTQ